MFSLSFEAGTIGTRGQQLIYNLKENTSWYADHKIVGLFVSDIINSQKIIPFVFLSNNKIYLNAYRAIEEAVNDVSVRIRISYVKIL